MAQHIYHKSEQDDIKTERTTMKARQLFSKAILLDRKSKQSSRETISITREDKQ